MTIPKTIKVMVRMPLRQGQASYLVPAKHPHDLGADGQLKVGAPEPAIQIPFGKAVEIPVRDERHLKLLLEDKVLTIIEDKPPVADPVVPVLAEPPAPVQPQQQSFKNKGR